MSCLSRYKRTSFIRRRQSYFASLDASFKTIYLASLDDNKSVSPFFEYLPTNFFLSIKMKLKINIKLFLSPAQFKSEYLSVRFFSGLQYLISYPLETLKYRKIVLTTLISFLSGFFAKNLANNLANVIFHFVFIIKNLTEQIIF